MSSDRVRVSQPPRPPLSSSPRARVSSVPELPRYEPLLELGRGGMGRVLLARAIGAEGFERLVAFKRMNIDLEGSEELLRRFADEARVMAQVRHANVVSVHHFGRDEHGPYLVADYVEGVSLQTLIERAVEHGTRASPEIVLRVVADALAGLHAAHETTDALGRPLGILHRDVSTQNVLIGKDGVSRITDFGVAKSVLNTQQTAQNRLVGKLLYMPPEYLQQEPVDRRLDVYAMGMTMWVALAGVEPWAELDDTALVAEILYGQLPALASVGATIAPELEVIVQKACAKEPGERYATAQEMAAAIHKLARQTGWMALHDEVASFVAELCGSDLGRVREQLARASWPPPDVVRSSSVPPEVVHDSSVPPSAQRWSNVGVQRIRVSVPDEDPSTAPTRAGLEPPVIPQSSGVRPLSSPPPAPAAPSTPELPPAPSTARAPHVDRERTQVMLAILLLVVGLTALAVALWVVLG